MEYGFFFSILIISILFLIAQKEYRKDSELLERNNLADDAYSKGSEINTLHHHKL